MDFSTDESKGWISNHHTQYIEYKSQEKNDYLNNTGLEKYIELIQHSVQVWSFGGPTQTLARGPLNPSPELQAGW